MEGKKLKKFMDYERISFEEEGKFDASKRGSQKEKDMFMAFWNKGFKQIMEDEQKMLDNQVAYSGRYHLRQLPGRSFG